MFYFGAVQTQVGQTALLLLTVAKGDVLLHPLPHFTSAAPGAFAFPPYIKGRNATATMISLLELIHIWKSSLEIPVQ